MNANVLMFFSGWLFFLVSALGCRLGLFRGLDRYGIVLAHILALYALLWLAPTLLAWAVWATWLR